MKGEEFLAITRKLESVAAKESPFTIRSEAYHQTLNTYDSATSAFEFHFDGKLKDTAAHLRDETIRLSMTSVAHPHFPRFNSNQDMARKLFEKEIAELIERN
ncbi:hypothetical protein VDG1235_1541 [Verrucomicrobiia bacterium DG1235]|nr:hypothetical protein VDG1235_1541 [Verrucomicrobiae bacterium DG1235]